MPARFSQSPQDMAAKYLTMVGQLQWLVTLGRFDLHAQVATISRFRTAPRQVGNGQTQKNLCLCH